MYMTKGFKIKNFGFQQQSECFGLIYMVIPTNTSAIYTSAMYIIVLFTSISST